MDNYNFLMDLLIGFLFNKYLIMVNSYKGIQIFDQAKKIINIIILVIIIYFNLINFFSILAINKLIFLKQKLQHNSSIFQDKIKKGILDKYLLKMLI